jgi:hypothetical protein
MSFFRALVHLAKLPLLADTANAFELTSVPTTIGMKSLFFVLSATDTDFIVTKRANIF